MTSLLKFVTHINHIDGICRYDNPEVCICHIIVMRLLRKKKKTLCKPISQNESNEPAQKSLNYPRFKNTEQKKIKQQFYK